MHASSSSYDMHPSTRTHPLSGSVSQRAQRERGRERARARETERESEREIERERTRERERERERERKTEMLRKLASAAPSKRQRVGSASQHSSKCDVGRMLLTQLLACWPIFTSPREPEDDRYHARYRHRRLRCHAQLRRRRPPRVRSHGCWTPHQVVAHSNLFF